MKRTIGLLATERRRARRVSRPGSSVSSGVTAGAPREGDDVVGRMRACSVTSRPSSERSWSRGVRVDGRLPRGEGDLRRLRVAVDVPLARRASCCRGRGRRRPSAPSAGGGGAGPARARTAIARFVRGPSVTSVSSPGPATGLLDDQVGTRTVAEGGAARLRQLRVAEALRAVGLRRRSRARGRAALGRPSGDLDVGPPGELQHGAGVALRDLRASTLPADAGDGDQVGVRRAARVQQREGVVDPGVDVEDQRGSIGHRADASRAAPSHATEAMARKVWVSTKSPSKCSAIGNARPRVSIIDRRRAGRPRRRRRRRTAPTGCHPSSGRDRTRREDDQPALGPIARWSIDSGAARNVARPRRRSGAPPRHRRDERQRRRQVDPIGRAVARRTTPSGTPAPRRRSDRIVSSRGTRHPGGCSSGHRDRPTTRYASWRDAPSARAAPITRQPHEPPARHARPGGDHRLRRGGQRVAHAPDSKTTSTARIADGDRDHHRQVALERSQPGRPRATRARGRPRPRARRSATPAPGYRRRRHRAG